MSLGCEERFLGGQSCGEASNMRHGELTLLEA